VEFLELPIAITVCVTFYTGCALSAGYQAFMAVGWDDKGVVWEMLMVPLLIAPTCLAIWILIIVDPGNAEYNQTFNWPFLFVITTFEWNFTSFGYQLYVQWRQDRSKSKLQIIDMVSAFADDPNLQKEFAEFAAKHYITESLQFIEDVKTFQKFFFEKAESWRVSKFKSLVETYILSGSRMEVNISFAMRSKMTNLYDNAQSHSRELHNAFDEAAKEVERMIHNGAWTEFLVKRSKQKHASRALKIAGVSPTDG